MRRILIQYLLPLVLCCVPVLAAILVALAVPEPAMSFYLERIQVSKIDWLILGLGLPLFLVQMYLTWRALRWTGHGFDESKDPWLKNLAQVAEWFPILGLLGTVMGILETFSQIAADRAPPSAQQIIESYAPAITSTGSGLFMALFNILPSWIVVLGRDLIVTLGSAGAPTGEVSE